MNGIEYEEWSRYYDVTDNKEFKAINQCMSGNESLDVWRGKTVLEIGCGSGRFTFNYVEEACRTLALDPDIERVGLLKDKIVKANLESKCIAIGGDLLELVNHTVWGKHFEEGFDIVLFPWSWAYIEKKEETLKLALDSLKPKGILVVTMVVDGEFENFVLESNLAMAADVDEVTNDLVRNRLSMDLLRRLLIKEGLILREKLVTTEFKFDTILKAAEMIMPLLSRVKKASLISRLDKYHQADGSVIMSDTVLCVCARDRRL